MASSKFAPSHETNETSRFCPSANTPFSIDGPSVMNLSFLHGIARRDKRLLRNTGELVRSLELLERVMLHAVLLIFHVDMAARPRQVTRPSSSATMTYPEWSATRIFLARRNIRRIRLHGNDRLPLHVRTHERAVRIVILQKRNKGCRHGNEFMRRDIDKINFFRRAGSRFSFDARFDKRSLKAAPLHRAAFPRA